MRSDTSHQEEGEGMEEEELEEEEEVVNGAGDSRQTPDGSTTGDSRRTIPSPS